MTTVITSARVDWADGKPAATITYVPTGGGSQVRTVDGQPEETAHASGEVFHVRLLSPDPMLPDGLKDAASYEEAVQVAEAYAAKLAARADDLAALAADLTA